MLRERRARKRIGGSFRPEGYVPMALRKRRTRCLRMSSRVEFDSCRYLTFPPFLHLLACAGHSIQYSLWTYVLWPTRLIFEMSRRCDDLLKES